jgi:F0F1-type ATP synthase membrane subunit b/b'
LAPDFTTVASGKRRGPSRDPDRAVAGILEGRVARGRTRSGSVLGVAVRQRYRWIALVGHTTTVLVAAIASAPAARATEGLVLEPDGRTLVLLIALFALLVYPVDRLVFRPIFRVLDARRGRIESNRARAEQLSRQAEEVLGRYEGSIREVRVDAERERRERLDAARAETAARTAEVRSAAESEIARAREDVLGALEHARVSLRSQAEELANEAAARILGRGLS